MYYMYVIQSDTDEFYTGYSENPERRLFEHNTGINLSTKGRYWKLVYYEAYTTEKYAREREFSIKKNRRMKTLLFKRIKESLSY